jgi:hypothetical protein
VVGKRSEPASKRRFNVSYDSFFSIDHKNKSARGARVQVNRSAFFLRFA